MRVRLLRLLLLPLIFFAVSCVRTSNVVKVERDGSGEIISRYHFSPEVSAFVGQFEALGPEAVFQVDATNLDLVREVITPKEESLIGDAANYGEGVSYLSHEIRKDSEGWEGYIAVYEFEDIRSVAIDQSVMPASVKKLVEASGEEMRLNRGGSLRFELEKNLLTIHSSLADGNVNEVVDIEQLSKARDMGMKPSEAIRRSADMTRGMRGGFFVRVVPGIEETNAAYVTGDLIILSDAEISKVMSDPDFQKFVDEAIENPEAVNLDGVKEMFSKIEGMTVELADEITVRFP
ncbi:MAG: hypothetical protein AAF733_08530 [Verrucomicrobiota bacterium]